MGKNQHRFPRYLQSKRPFVLFVVNEFSRFPFAFLCNDMKTKTVVKCMSDLFCSFGQALYVGAFLCLKELKQVLAERGIAASKSTPYQPAGIRNAKE